MSFEVVLTRVVDEVEELVDKPGTTKGTCFDLSQWNFLSFLMRCGFWPQVQWSLYPNSSQIFPSERTVHCWFFFCEHLAVGCYRSRRIFRCSHGLQFGLVQVFLADHVHTCSGIYHKLFPRVYVDAAGKIHSSEGEQNVALSSLQSVLEICPQISQRRVLLMKNFDLYFTKRWTCIFSDVCLTPQNRWRIWRLSVLWYTTQLSCTFHNCNCTSANLLMRERDEAIWCKYISRSIYTAVDWISQIGFYL